uniref:Uncharacterized protein TCIL3000_4_2850 n=1 Tax=Trypanosoma congolense (strain IL3000) TaxID=1068625 RepID=G0ULD7_TRYCI|nr:unnamed protein product [Trypanosoma congolense IL3000]
MGHLARRQGCSIFKGPLPTKQQITQSPLAQQRGATRWSLLLPGAKYTTLIDPATFFFFFLSFPTQPTYTNMLLTTTPAHTNANDHHFSSRCCGTSRLYHAVGAYTFWCNDPLSTLHHGPIQKYIFALSPTHGGTKKRTPATAAKQRGMCIYIRTYMCVYSQEKESKGKEQ